MKKILIALLLMIPSAVYAEEMIAVSADIVEISGSIEKTRGFAWNQFFDFSENTIDGILAIGDFQRKTQLTASLKLLETESKAQLLQNPKIVTRNGQQASLCVGGEIPIPTVNSQGVGAQMQKYGVILTVLPVIVKEEKNAVDVVLQLEVSNPDYSRTVSVSATTIPSMVTRQIQTEVVVKPGETLVIGGLKRSNHNVSENRVPVLGSIPLIGKLFSSTDVTEEQSSLFVFLSFEIIK